VTTTPTTTTVKSQAIEISEVRDVQITTVEQEVVGEEAGLFVREFRFYGVPPADDVVKPQVLVVRIKSADADDLKVSSPTSEF
jgi:hypothetical protein